MYASWAMFIDRGFAKIMNENELSRHPAKKHLGRVVCIVPSPDRRILIVRICARVVVF